MNNFAGMLTKEEKEFIAYWEKHRDTERTLKRALIVSGPIGFIFSFPILLAVLFHGWYKRMVPVTRGQMIVILICVVSITLFYAFFKQQRVWDRNEQYYKELKLKAKLGKENGLSE